MRRQREPGEQTSLSNCAHVAMSGSLPDVYDAPTMPRVPMQATRPERCVAEASAILAECPIRLLSLSIQEFFRLPADTRSIGSASETLAGNQRLCFTAGRVRARRRSGALTSILAATA